MTKRTCPSCQTQTDAAESHCKTCGWRFFSTTSIGPSLVSVATRPKIQIELDLAVTIDRTGSSLRFAAGVRDAFALIVKSTKAKARDVRVFLQSHGDLDEGQDPVLHTDGGTAEQAIADLTKISFEGGGDPDEHHLDAVKTLFNIVPWAADPARARGAIIAFTTADSKPLKSGESTADLGRAIKAKGLLLYIVAEPTPTLHELVCAAEGMMFQITNNPNQAEMQDIADRLSRSIVATASSGSTLPMAV